MPVQHGRTRNLHRLIAMSVLAVAFAVALPASASGATVWSTRIPAAGATVYDSQPTVSVHIDGDLALRDRSGWIKVDGLYLRNPKLVFDRNPDGSIDYTSATFSAPVHWVLSNTTHRVDVTIYNANLTKNVTSWTFRVSAAPTLSDEAPSPESVATTTTPSISSLVGGAGPIVSYGMTVDGVDVPAVYSAGRVSAVLTGPLENDRTHDVTVTVTNAAGLSAVSSWSFYLQIYPKMPVTASCVGCHVGYPDAHPVDACVLCHGEGGPDNTGYDDPAESHAPGTLCSQCHGDLTDCTYCHGQDYATVPPLHELENDAYHFTTVTTCAPCHQKQLAVEHYRFGLDCLACHTSGDNVVRDAIAAGDTACTTCHGGGHAEQHQSPLDATCEQCHMPELTGEHLLNRGLTCDTCHESTDPAVVAAIEMGDRACSACHTVTPHTAEHESELAVACDACHAANLVIEHVSDRALTCATCHESTDPVVVGAIGAGDTACLTCHDFGDHPYPVSTHQAEVASLEISGTLRDIYGGTFQYYDGTTVTYADQACGACHLMDLSAEHSKPSSSVSAEDCAACHASPRDSFESWNQTCQQGGCHATYHGDMPAKHHQAYSGREASCGIGDGDCHGSEWQGDLAAVHSAAWRDYGFFDDLTSYPYGCAICHSSPSSVPPAPTSCATCHLSRHGAAQYP